MRAARTWRLSMLALLSLAVPASQLALPAVARADTDPTVTITSPGPGASLKGNGVVQATGTVDHAGSDSGVSLQLLLDGAPTGSPVLCPTGVGQADCTLSLPYDLTGLSGTHSFAATFVTANVPAGVSSVAVPVNVSTPPPVATVSAPATNGSTVSGLTAISGSGSVDPSQTDWPTSLELWVNGTKTDTYACPSPGVAHKSCSTTGFSYDFTGASGTQNIVVRVVTNRIPATDSPALSANASSPPPTATITSPSGGANLQGVISVAATGTVDASQTDYASTMQLYVNGVAQSPAYSCGGSSRVCSPVFTYDATGVTGGRTFTVRLSTTRGLHVDTADVSVNVTTPAPTAVVTSPTAGSTVSGTVSVTATGQVDPSQTDTGKTLQLLVDGSPVGAAQTCPSSRTCTLSSLSWNASGQVGTHTLAVTFVTTNLKTVTSPAVSVTVTSPAPTATVLAPTAGATVKGVVAITGQGVVNASQSDTPTSLQLYVDGVAVGTPGSCGSSADPKVCPGTFTWDATGMTGQHFLAVRLTTASANSVTSSPVAVTVVSPLPAVAVTTPTASSTVAGVVTVGGTMTVDASQVDTALRLQLVVDGAASGDPVSCAGSDRSCAASLTWDSTGLSGSHLLQVRGTSLRGATALSTGVSVTVANPLPTVVITSPSEGSVVRDTAVVTASGVVDAGQNDTAGRMTFAVDGAPLDDPQSCSGGANPRACSASFSWATSGLVGRHTISVTFTSAKGSAATVSESVLVWTDTALSLTPLKPVPYGHLASVRGTLVARSSSKGVSGAAVVLTFSSRSAARRTVTVHTDARGHFAYAYKVTGSASVSASFAALPSWGASSATGRLAASAVISCTKAPVVHAHKVSGSCSVPGLAKGGKVVLQYLSGGRWKAAGSVKVTTGHVAWTLALPKAGTYSVRLFVPAGRVFAATTGTPVKVVVR